MPRAAPLVAPSASARAATDAVTIPARTRPVTAIRAKRLDLASGRRAGHAAAGAVLGCRLATRERPVSNNHVTDPRPRRATLPGALSRAPRRALRGDRGADRPGPADLRRAGRVACELDRPRRRRRRAFAVPAGLRARRRRRHALGSGQRQPGLLPDHEADPQSPSWVVG